MTVWDRMIGQPDAVEVLRHAALEGRAICDDPGSTSRQSLSHAWLITGPPGSGRSIAAKCLAAALQCTGDPIGCGKCAGCHTTFAGTNPDVAVQATDLIQIKVGEARQWVEHVYDAPIGGRWSITIIEDADRVTERTANVFLKGIEEPPDRGMWIICAPGPEDVLPTIRSRCRSLRLRTPSAHDVAQYLVDLEGTSFEDAHRAALLAQSHVGFARALLRDPALRTRMKEMFALPLRAQGTGQAILAAEKMHELAKKQADEASVESNARARAELLRSLGIADGKRVPPAFRGQIRAMEEDQKRRTSRALKDVLDRALVDLLGFYRDVVATQLETGAQVVNVDMIEEIEKIANQTAPEQTIAAIDAVEQARERILTNAAPLLVLEAMTVAIAN